MKSLAVLRNYIAWHYTTGIIDLLHIWWNYVWFIGHLFSVKDVILTFFTPFRRLSEKGPNPLADLAAFAEAFTVTLMMRIVGMVLRTALLLVALIAFVLVMVVFSTTFFFWLFAPFLLAHMVVAGIGQLFI